jgi:hypothetical protein
MEEEYPGTILLAEANQWPADLIPYFGDGDEFHMAFHFPIMPRMFMALKQEHHGPIVDIIKQTPKIPDNCQWAIFLRNHDELTLEMCTDEERDYMYKTYAENPKMKINIGIRRRLMPSWTGISGATNSSMPCCFAYLVPRCFTMGTRSGWGTTFTWGTATGSGHRCSGTITATGDFPGPTPASSTLR